MSAENCTLGFGIFIALVGVAVLWRSDGAFDKLTPNKYRKVDMLNLAAPGLILIAIAAIIIVIPHIIKMVNINRCFDAIIAVHGKTNRVDEKKELLECKKPGGEASQTNSHNGIGIFISTQADKNRAQ